MLAKKNKKFKIFPDGRAKERRASSLKKLQNLKYPLNGTLKHGGHAR
jgi:hypothetical protein